MNGVDLTSVKELLGHKSLSMTMRYSHLAPGHTKKAVNILDKALKIEEVNEVYLTIFTVIHKVLVISRYIDCGG